MAEPGAVPTAQPVTVLDKCGLLLPHAQAQNYAGVMCQSVRLCVSVCFVFSVCLLCVCARLSPLPRSISFAPSHARGGVCVI